jgi:hypothetical protein
LTRNLLLRRYQGPSIQNLISQRWILWALFIFFIRIWWYFSIICLVSTMCIAFFLFSEELMHSSLSFRQLNSLAWYLNSGFWLLSTLCLTQLNFLILIPRYLKMCSRNLCLVWYLFF